jgi:2-methylcitrate dehydratase PrpD
VISDIARLAASVSFDRLSPAAQDRLLLCLLANLSVGIAGVRHAVVPEPAAAGGRYRLLSGSRAGDPRAAAFWNGCVMHARTQDDFHPVGNLHIGTVVLPALLAVADESELTGANFLSALAAGYAVAVGLSRQFSPVTTPRGLRSTCLYAPFGATAAVARARAVSSAQMANALALTTAFNAGETQTWVDGSDEWQIHAGLGAQNGLVANDLAAQGVRGGEHALDGPAGFYRAVVGEAVSFKDIEADFDASNAIEETAIKRYPVSGICQSVVLAAEQVARELAAKAGRAAALRIELNAFEITYPGTLNRGPFRSFGDRLMSAAFCASSVVAHGGFRFDDFHSGPQAPRDELIGRTEVVPDAGLPLLSSRVIARTTDGGSITASVKDSRAAVAIDWSSIEPWAIALFQEAGRTRKDYEACRDAVRDLATAKQARLPI